MIGMMRKDILIFLVLAISVASPANTADFAVQDMKIGREGFLIISLENLTPRAVHFPEELKEKVFLTISIDGLRRAEYKLKYMPGTLFASHGKAEWKTNFRLRVRARVRVEMNIPTVIDETRLHDNRMDRTIQPPHE